MVLEPNQWHGPAWAGLAGLDLLGDFFKIWRSDVYGLARIEMGHVGGLVIRSIRSKESNPDTSESW